VLRAVVSSEVLPTTGVQKVGGFCCCHTGSAIAAGLSKFAQNREEETVRSQARKRKYCSHRRVNEAIVAEKDKLKDDHFSELATFKSAHPVFESSAPRLQGWPQLQPGGLGCSLHGLVDDSSGCSLVAWRDVAWCNGIWD